MQTYCVGGAVRDELLGLPVKDRDYVVVGSTPEEMIKLGFKPIGNNFPVFLHPQTREEYALARTERKISVGYKGFEIYTNPDVTLEQDLARRDLTVNAIAKDTNGKIIDPFNGVNDLHTRTLRHVSAAFVEDPVRILRVARFAARYEFFVATETLKLMRAMVRNGEAGSLVPERVWQELSRGLMEHKPSLMIAMLQESGALSVVMPELGEQFQTSDPSYTLKMLDLAAQKHSELPVRFAILNYHSCDKRNAIKLHSGLERVKNLCKRLKTPNDCKDLALLAIRLSSTVEKATNLSDKDILTLFDEADAYRKPQRFFKLLELCGYAQNVYSDQQQIYDGKADLLRRTLRAAQAVDAGEIAARHSDVLQIKREIQKERRRVIGTIMAQLSEKNGEMQGNV